MVMAESRWHRLVTPVRRGAGDSTRVVAFALRLVWRADRRRLTALVVLQLTSAAGLGLVVILVRSVLRHLLVPTMSGVSMSTTVTAVLPGVAVMGLLGSIGAVLQVFTRREQVLLGTSVDRASTDIVLGAAVGVELARFEDPAFHDRIERAQFASRRQPVMLIYTLTGVIGTLASTLAMMVTFAMMAAWLVPLLALIAVPILRSARSSHAARYRLHTELSENRRHRDYLEHLLTGRDDAKEIRAFGIGPTLRERWHHRYARQIDLETQLWKASTRRSLRARLASDAGLAALLGAVLYAATIHLLPLPTALTVLAAMALLAQRIQGMGTLLASLGTTLTYLRDLQTLTEDTTAAPIPADPVPTAEGSPFGSVGTSRMSFTYPSATGPTLTDIDITLHAGQTVALVGPNGSGKTTLAKILAGLYSPHSGDVLLDNRPVTDPARLRAATAVLFQDFTRYKLSAADNIALGRPDRPATAETVAEAALRAGAHEFLDTLPEGYRTVLSTEFAGGTDLSLGQWQRVALARAFYRDAGLVILDEPTASMDARAEADLYTHLRQLLAGRTVLLITHRFASVRTADHIYVLDRGHITEHGTHDQLIELDGTYACLFHAQAAPYLAPVT